MTISTVAHQPAAPTPAKPEGGANRTPEALVQPGQDQVTLSGQKTPEVIYPDPRTNKMHDGKNLQAMLEESDRKAQAIIDLIRPLVEQQGLNFAKVVSGEQKLTADPATIKAAQDAISEDGEFGVRKTSERILSFAKAAIGGDASKIDKIRAAVEKGFDEAKQILGGVLPEISQQTLKTIQDEFDRWKNEGIPEGETVTLPKSKPESTQGAVKN